MVECWVSSPDSDGSGWIPFQCVWAGFQLGHPVLLLLCGLCAGIPLRHRNSLIKINGRCGFFYVGLMSLWKMSESVIPSQRYSRELCCSYQHVVWRSRAHLKKLQKNKWWHKNNNDSTCVFRGMNRTCSGWCYNNRTEQPTSLVGSHTFPPCAVTEGDNETPCEQRRSNQNWDQWMSHWAGSPGGGVDDEGTTEWNKSDEYDSCSDNKQFADASCWPLLHGISHWICFLSIASKAATIRQDLSIDMELCTY